MNPVVAQVLLMIMMVVIAVVSYNFFRSTIEEAKASAKSSAKEVIRGVEENLEITSINRKNITVVNKDGESEVIAVYLDSNRLNFSPSIIPKDSMIEMETNKIIYDPISRIRVGDKIIIITRLGRKWEVDVPGKKVDRILTLENFTILNGTWTQDTYITGSS